MCPPRRWNKSLKTTNSKDVEEDQLKYLPMKKGMDKPFWKKFGFHTQKQTWNWIYKTLILCTHSQNMQCSAFHLIIYIFAFGDIFPCEVGVENSDQFLKGQFLVVETSYLRLRCDSDNIKHFCFSSFPPSRGKMQLSLPLANSLVKNSAWPSA